MTARAASWWDLGRIAQSAGPIRPVLALERWRHAPAGMVHLDGRRFSGVYFESAGDLVRAREVKK